MAGLLDFFQSASNSVAGNVSAPVDGLAWALRKLGVPMPANPMGGSDWMQDKGLTKPVEQSGASLAGDAMGMIFPMVAAAKAAQIAKGALQMGENAATQSTLNKQAGVILYHGSKSPEYIPKVLDDGQFQGLFASTSQRAARSHGGSLYRMTIPDESVLRMGHDWPEASLYASVAKNMPYKSSAEDVRTVAEMAGSGRGLFEIDPQEALRLASVIDPGESLGAADWTLQRLRGQAAKDHGFRAVEMPDEHGISHLVLPGASLRPANEQAKILARGGAPPTPPPPPPPAAPMYGPGISFDSWLRLDDAARKAALPVTQLRRGMRPHEVALFESYR